MTICGQVIGQVSERIAILCDKNGDINKINKLEKVLKCLEKLYSYYEQRNNRPDFEQASAESLFDYWQKRCLNTERSLAECIHNSDKAREEISKARGYLKTIAKKL